MYEQFKKVIGHSAIYGLALVGSTIGTMILTPMFLHRLSKPEYGMNEVLSVMASMLYIITGLGISAVYIKIYVNDCKDREEQKGFFSSTVVCAAGIALFLIVVSFGISKAVSTLLFGNASHAHLVQLAIIGGGLQLMLSMVNQCLRAKQWAVKFVTVSLLQFVVVIALSLYLVGLRNLGVLGIQTSAVTCYVIAAAFGLFVLRRELTPRFSTKMLKHLLIVSLPVFPSTIAPWVLNVSDRYFLNHYCGLADTGLYAAGYKIGMVGMYVFITATQYAWPPIFYAYSDQKDIAKLCASYAKYYLLLLVVGALGFSIFAPEIIRIISNREFWSADRIVPYIAASYVMYGLQFYSIPFFIKAGKGKLLSQIMGGAALGNLAMNFVLVPRYGISGAVASTVVTFAVECVLSLGLANRFFPIPYEKANLLKVLVLGGGVYAFSSFIKGTPIPPLAFKFAAFPVLVMLLFLTRFFNPRELLAMQGATSKVIRRLLPQPSKAG